MGSIALNRREGPGPAAAGPALRPHISPVPRGEDGMGCEGGRGGHAAIGTSWCVGCDYGERGGIGCRRRNRRVGVFPCRRRGAIRRQDMVLGGGVRGVTISGAEGGQEGDMARVFTVVGWHISQGGSRMHRMAGTHVNDQKQPTPMIDDTRKSSTTSDAGQGTANASRFAHVGAYRPSSVLGRGSQAGGGKPGEYVSGMRQTCRRRRCFGGRKRRLTGTKPVAQLGKTAHRPRMRVGWGRRCGVPEGAPQLV